MSVTKDFVDRCLKDLQNGVIFPKKVNGEWTEELQPYENTLKYYCTGTVVRNAFLAMYKTLPPIEDFSPEEKKEWKKYVNEIFPNTPPQFRLQAVKIIYTIGTLSS